MLEWLTQPVQVQTWHLIFAFIGLLVLLVCWEFLTGDNEGALTVMSKWLDNLDARVGKIETRVDLNTARLNRVFGDIDQQAYVPAWKRWLRRLAR